jgi:SRSO17 transposase
VRKPERERPLGKSERRYENSKIDLKETRLEAVNWIHLAQDREKGRALVNTVTNPLVPKNVGNFLASQ